MLSRIAESMFWIGRYVERAEDTARLLQVLGYDSREPTSIYSSWAAARDNARRAREVIPLDLWESINTTWHQLPREPFGVTGAHTFLNWARERSALFTGIARGIMVRDDGWQFMSMGRSLEQVDMTSRMVASASLTTGSTQWPAVLRGCGGHDAFLRTYRGLYTDREAAQFLIMDARFPRSIMHGLVAAADSLRRITQNNTLAARQSEFAARALGQLRARLEYAEVDDLLDNLNTEMTEVQDVAARVTNAVTTNYFAAAEPAAWITEGTR